MNINVLCKSFIAIPPIIIMVSIYLFIIEYPSFCYSYDLCNYDAYKNTWSFIAKIGLAIVFSLTFLGIGIYVSKLSSKTTAVNVEIKSINLAIKEAKIFKEYGKTDEAIKRLNLELQNYPNNEKLLNELKRL
jgi:hypothetical protein